MIRASHCKRWIRGMEEAEEIKQTLLVQQAYELLCPDCEVCITRDVILRKRKRGNEASHQIHDVDHHHHLVQTAVLEDQGAQDLFCPICDYTIIEDLSLDSGKGYDTQQNLLGLGFDEIERYLPYVRKRPHGSLLDVFCLNELNMRSVLSEQDDFDLWCPDCDACITTTLIFEKRRNLDSVEDEAGMEGADFQEEEASVREAESQEEGTGVGAAESWVRGKSPAESTSEADDVSDDNGIRHQPELDGKDGRAEEKDGGENDNPPSKRRRKSVVVEITEEPIRIFPALRNHDLTCPDCKSVITSNVILRAKVKKPSPAGESLKDVNGGAHQVKRGCRRWLDDNPWKSRYKLFYRRGKLQGVPDEQVEELQSQLTRYRRSSTRRPLTEPLLPSEHSGSHITFRERLNLGQNYFSDSLKSFWIYFLTILFLWGVWFLLHFV